MIDYYDNASEKAPSHYEVVKSVDCVEAAEAVKKEAFQAMDALEGWCSKLKAGVLIDFVLMLKPETVVEIGVFGGKSAVPMAIACRANQKGVVYGIDPWAAVNSTEGMDGVNLSWWGTIDHEAVMQGLVDKIIEFQLINQLVLVRDTSEGAKPIENIDILHIDGNHSEKAAMYDIHKWVPLVRKGGIVILDDINWKGPQEAVKWLNANCVKLATFNDSGSEWGIWVKS